MQCLSFEVQVYQKELHDLLGLVVGMIEAIEQRDYRQLFHSVSEGPRSDKAACPVIQLSEFLLASFSEDSLVGLYNWP